MKLFLENSGAEFVVTNFLNKFWCEASGVFFLGDPGTQRRKKADGWEENL